MGIRRMIGPAMLVVVLVVGFASCTLFNRLFGSGDAVIVSFNIDGLVGNAVVDASARTVSANVEPVDLSTVSPTIGVSPGATIDSPELVDGSPVTFHVTAENGNVEAWTITVTVLPGIAFTLDGARVVLLKGLTDSYDDVHNAEVGDNVPVAGWDTNYAQFYLDASSTGWDVYYSNGSNGGAEPAYVDIYVDDTAAGTHSQSLFTFTYFVGAGSGYNAQDGDSAGESLTLNLISVGAEGQVVRGTFSGTVVATSDSSLKTVTGGYLKLIRVADTNFYPYAFG